MRARWAFEAALLAVARQIVREGRSVRDQVLVHHCRIAGLWADIRISAHQPRSPSCRTGGATDGTPRSCHSAGLQGFVVCVCVQRELDVSGAGKGSPWSSYSGVVLSAVVNVLICLLIVRAIQAKLQTMTVGKQKLTIKAADIVV